MSTNQTATELGDKWCCETCRRLGEGELVAAGAQDATQPSVPVRSPVILGRALLASPAAGRVLDAAQRWRSAHLAATGLVYARNRSLEDLAAAVDAMVGDRAEPVPVPDSGPGWDRASIQDLIRRVKVAEPGDGWYEAKDGDGALIDALLYDAESYQRTAERKQVALEQRDAARTEVEGVRAELTRKAEEVDDLRATLGTLTGQLGADRAALIEAKQRVRARDEALASCVWADPRRMSGAPCLGGTRILVSTIVGLLDEGLDGDQIRALYPDVTDGHLVAARHFVHEVVDVDRLRGELERLHTWQGLMSLLDEQYPPDVQLGPGDDPGPRILALTRALNAARAELEQLHRRDGVLVVKPDESELATARQDAAADALEDAANDANRALDGQRAFTAADLRQRAAEMRTCPVPGQPEPATDSEASDV